MLVAVGILKSEARETWDFTVVAFLWSSVVFNHTVLFSQGLNGPEELDENSPLDDIFLILQV